MHKAVFVERGFRWQLIVLLLLSQLWFCGSFLDQIQCLRIDVFNNPAMVATANYQRLGNAIDVFLASAENPSEEKAADGFRNYLREKNLVLFTVEEWGDYWRLHHERNQSLFYFLWILDTVFLGLLLCKKDWYLKYALFLTVGGSILVWGGYRLRQPSPSMRYLDEVEFLPPFRPHEFTVPYARLTHIYERDGKKVFLYLAQTRAAYARSVEEAQQLLQEN